MNEQEADWLTEKAPVQERPFTPSRPGIFGQLVVRFRTLWSQVATKWYVRPIIQQQNAYNLALIEKLREQENRLTQLDREQAELTRETAEITTQLIQLNQLLTRIDQRVAQLEENKTAR